MGPNGGEAARPQTPTEIQAAELLVANIGGVLKLWSRPISMVSQLKDDAIRMASGSPDLHEKAMATLRSIVRDLDSRDKAVS